MDKVEEVCGKARPSTNRIVVRNNAQGEDASSDWSSAGSATDTHGILITILSRMPR